MMNFLKVDFSNTNFSVFSLLKHVGLVTKLIICEDLEVVIKGASFFREMQNLAFAAVLIPVSGCKN